MTKANKNVARPRAQNQPNWKPRLLGHAIALATAAMQAPAAFASCPGTQANLTTSSCSLTGSQSLTVTNTGAIVAPSFLPAVFLTPTGGSLSVTNSGLLMGGVYGISALPGTGAINITNNDDGVILGDVGGVQIGSGTILTLNNAGVIGGVNAVGPVAFGVELFSGVTGSITNSGVIRANANNTDGRASAWGIDVDSVLSGLTITNNNGTISASAFGTSSASAFAAGIFVRNDMDGTITNNGGSIIARAQATESSATALGINVGGVLTGSIDNSGSISASASASGFNFTTAQATGIAVNGDIIDGGSVTNTGTIAADAFGFDGAEAFAVGINAGEGLFDGASINNAVVRDGLGNIIATGAITATAEAEFTAQATGIQVDGSIELSSVTNDGTIDVTAVTTELGGFPNSAVANGMNVDGSLFGASLGNSGDITATANGFNEAIAAGIRINGSIVTSSSTIPTGTEAAALVVITPSSLNNSGTITATAQGSSEAGASYASAAGIVVNASIGAGSSLTNSGQIDANAFHDYYTDSFPGVAFALGVGVGGIDSGESGAGLAGGSFNNTTTGSINAMASGTSAGAVFAVGVGGASGFFGSGSGLELDIGGTFTNSGEIGAQAYLDLGLFDFAVGVNIDSIAASGTFNNLAGGSISALASASRVFSESGLGLAGVRAQGVNVGSIAGSLSNSGEISAEAINNGWGSESSLFPRVGASATGLDVGSLTGTGSITNAGTIDATASAVQGSSSGGPGGFAFANAYGLNLQSSLLAGNSITVTSTGEINAAATAAFDARAVGVSLGISGESGGTGVMTGTLSNAGVITADANSDETGNPNITNDAVAIGILVNSDIVGPGSLTNSGQVTATGTGSNADAYGIEIKGGLFDLLDEEAPPVGATVTNTASGKINATATGTSRAVAVGVTVQSTIQAASSLTNAGTITAIANASSAYAGGIEVGSFGGNVLQGSILNSGTINAHAQGETSETSATSAAASGILLRGDMADGSSLTNNGTINATAAATSEAAVWGIDVLGDVASGATLSNGGTVANASAKINATASASAALAQGIRVSDSVDGALNNYGTITAKAFGATEATAHGIVVDSSIGESGVLTNGGTINATAVATGVSESETGSGIAVGVLIQSELAGSVTNEGSINAQATSGFDGAEGFAGAFGILVYGTSSFTTGTTGTTGSPAVFVNQLGSMLGGSTLTNNGSITAIANGSSSVAVGIAVLTVDSGATIQNNGTITVTANSAGGGGGESGISFSSIGSLGAAGIAVGFLDAGATLTNDGTITANTDAGTGTGWTIFVNDGGGSSGASGSEEFIPALVQNLSGGLLNGNVHLVNTSLSNSGIIAMPVGTGGVNDSSFVGGDYDQGEGGVLQVNAYDYNNYGRMTVAGNADVADSGNFVVNAVGSNNAGSNHQLLFASTIQNVLDAGTLTSGTMTVTDDIPLWNFTAVRDEANQAIDLVVRGDMRNVVAATGPSWAIPAAAAFDAAADGEHGSDMATVIAGLAQVTSNAQLAAAATQLVPVLIGRSVEQANLQLSGLSTLVAGRMDTHRGVVEPSGHDQNLWVRTFGTSGEQDDDQGYPGYETESYGLVIGYDTDVGDAWNLGGAFAYAQPEVTMDDFGFNHKIESDSYQGALYGYWDGGNDTFIDLMGIYGQSSNDSSRDIVLPGIALRTAEGSYDTTYWRMSAALGHDFAMADKLTLTPIANVTYTYVEDDSYTESGAADLNLRVDSNDQDSLIVGLDLRLAYEVMASGVLTAHVGAGYDTMTDDTSLAAAFVGGGPIFTTVAPELDDTVIRAGVGAEFNASDTIELHFNYDYEVRDTYENNLVTGTLRWKI